MKKTTTQKQDTRTKQLVVRKERVRELNTPDLEHVAGGVYEYRSHASSCC